MCGLNITTLSSASTHQLLMLFHRSVTSPFPLPPHHTSSAQRRTRIVLRVQQALPPRKQLAQGGPIARALAFALEEVVAALRIDPSCFLTAFDFSVATSVRPRSPRCSDEKNAAQSGRSKSVHHTFGSSPHVAVSASTSFDSIPNASSKQDLETDITPANVCFYFVVGLSSDTLTLSNAGAAPASPTKLPGTKLQRRSRLPAHLMAPSIIDVCQSLFVAATVATKMTGGVPLAPKAAPTLAQHRRGLAAR